MQGNTVTARGQRGETQFLTVVNAESSATMNAGDCVCWNMNGTDDGIAVILANTGGAAKATSLFAGVVTKQMANSNYGVTQISGLCQYAKVIRATRAATTDTWASIAALTIGDLCNVDTVNNALSRSAAGAASGFVPVAILAQSAASVTTLASSVTSTTFMTVGSASTAMFSYVKVYLRAV